MMRRSVVSPGEVLRSADCEADCSGPVVARVRRWPARVLRALGCALSRRRCRPVAAAGAPPDERRAPSAASNDPAASPLPPVAGATGPRVVILGDSLTAGLGLPMARAYPSLLQRHIDDAGLSTRS